MYQSKGRGRAASTVYARKTHDPLERLSLSSRLRRAIAGDELELHYQPIVWTASGRLHSMEALLRWNDPERGLVHPDQFIPAAEEMSLLEPIGEWVVGAMARQLREWEAMGLRPRMSFNVSPRELHRPDFAHELIERLRAEGVDPARLTMELTESATLREPERIGPLLRELHGDGPADRDRRLRRGLVVAVAAAPAARSRPSRSTARSCARSPTTRSRARSCAR